MAGTTEDKLAKLDETKSALKASINGSASIVGDKFSDYPGAIDDFRSKIATAITAKGIATAATDTPDQMAANVEAIQTSNIQTVNLHVTNNISAPVEIYIKGSGNERYSSFNVFPYENVDYEIEYGSAIFVLGPSRYGRFIVSLSGGLNQVFADEGMNTASYILFAIHLYGDNSITFSP